MVSGESIFCAWFQFCKGLYVYFDNQKVSYLTLYIQKEKRGRRCPGVPKPLALATEHCNRNNDCYRSRFATLAFVLEPSGSRLDAEEWELVKRILRDPEIKNV